MQFKLILVFAEDSKTDSIMNAARESGATGATVINNARGEGITQKTTFFGLSLDTQRDVLLFLVEQNLSRSILEKISKVGEFDTTSGTGIALQINVEDAVGVAHQVKELSAKIEGEI